MSRDELHLLLKRVDEYAEEQHGVVSRKQIRDTGLDRWHIRNQIDAGRWRRGGQRSLIVHQGDLPERGEWWRVLFEIGPSAALDGVTALKAAGLTGYEDPICVSLPRGCSPRGYPDGVVIKITDRRGCNDIIGAGIPRVRPPVAAIRAALWAKTDRQAAFILVLAAQQRLTTGQAMQDALSGVLRDKRRGLIRRVILDIVDGVRAMGELDFAALCRRRGLPPPSRQVVRRAPNGRVYLDVYWDQWGLVVEIDGIQHSWGVAPVDDALRQNELTIASDAVLRIPVLGLRLAPDAFMDQVARWLAAHGR